MQTYFDLIFSVISISALLVECFSENHIGAHTKISVSPGSCRTSFSISLCRLDVINTGRWLLQSRESPFLCTGVTLPTLRDIGKIPHLNNKLIIFAKGILIVLLCTFNTFVGMLLRSIAFL